ncbi:MAG: hypothetical protein RL338_68 [Chloroflexota bacterium]|jgi:D-aminopeptidase
MTTPRRPRARDLGIVVGDLPTGPLNAITDVPGVAVGHATLVEGDGPLAVGRGPVRTGVTVVLPHAGNVWTEAVFAAPHRLNGNGEMTGLEWIREAGLLASPIAITNTHSVGVVRDALLADRLRRRPDDEVAWGLPVVAETWDGRLNDINGFHVRPEHVTAALDAARPGPVEEGSVGGGTGMVSFGFKAGIGTASRRVELGGEPFLLGVLVQANFGRRPRFSVAGVPVGRAIPESVVPLPSTDVPATPPGSPPIDGAGSVIVIVATDAPLLPGQCERLAQRAALGIGRTGGAGETSSGDLMLAFSTGNGPFAAPAYGTVTPPTTSLRMVVDHHLDPLFHATVEATEEAVLNSLLAAPTMTGRDGVTAHALPVELLLGALARR